MTSEITIDVKTHTFTDNNKTLVIWFNASFRDIRVMLLQQLQNIGETEQDCISLDTELVEVKFSKNKDFITLHVNPECVRVTVLVTRLDKNKNIKQSWTFKKPESNNDNNNNNSNNIFEMGLATLLKNGLTIGNNTQNVTSVKEISRMELKNENISAVIKRKS